MTDKEKLIELFEAIPHAKRLYPDLFVDYLIENGVTIVVHCKKCKWCINKDEAVGCGHCDCINRDVFANDVEAFEAVSLDDYCSYGEVI